MGEEGIEEKRKGGEGRKRKGMEWEERGRKGGGKGIERREGEGRGKERREANLSELTHDCNFSIRETEFNISLSHIVNSRLQY